MDRKTPEELRADHSIRGLQSLRGTLQLHWGQMNTAWQTHNPADGNVDVRVLAQLDAWWSLLLLRQSRDGNDWMVWGFMRIIRIVYLS